MSWNFKREEHDETREVKRTRTTELKEEESKVREEDTYQGGLEHNSDICIQEIPTPITAPQNEKLMSLNSTAKIMFDVETTSVVTNADIIQLSAVHKQDEFNVYMMPEKEITSEASRVTQLTVVGGRLCLKEKPVDSKSAVEGLKSFVEWLKAKEMPVVLFAHNAKSFDCQRIIYSLQKCDLLSSFQSCVVGFVDTIILFKTVLPQREKYSLPSLVSDLLNVSYSAHDSLEDVRALQRLVFYKEVNDKAIIESSFTLNYAINNIKYCLNKADNLRTLRPLIASKVISKGMGDKIAASGLTLSHLKLSILRGGKDGLRSVLTEKVNGKPRVTANSRIIAALLSHLENL
ncbi:DNA polymerase III PolC-type-like [Montipora foliosa]|uniref:DNA polymerase III PolC-type-like n=1 Tax=Montipora foliosa TaxID=591990 RepID=UPI0035F1A52E